jgi:hypothetical protein
MVTYSTALIPYLVPGALVFLGMGILEALKPGKPKWIAAGVIAALLFVAIIALRSAVGGGIADLINQFYDAAEAAQAYLYKRMPGGGGDPRMGAAWISCLIGLLASLPPAKYRREALALVTLIAMFAFAYYGLLPSGICVAVLLAALLVAVPKGNVLSSLPLLLAVMLVFGRTIIASFLSGTPEEVSQALEVGYRYLTYMSLMLPVLYILHVSRSALQGMENTVLPMVSGIAEFIMRTGGVLLLPPVLGGMGIFIAEVLAWLGADLILIPSYFITMSRITKRENHP